MRRLLLILIPTVLLLSLGGFGWWAFGRTPEEQLQDRQQAFLEAVESRDWDEVRAMLTEDYMDGYGHDRDGAVEAARQVLGAFFSLTVKPRIVQLQALPDLAMVKMQIRIEGRGAGFSEAVVSQVNSIEEPWFFHWHKKGRWPWDWRIVQIHNDGLHIPR
jgi:ketosteroid isomerase-like protein